MKNIDICQYCGNEKQVFPYLWNGWEYVPVCLSCAAKIELPCKEIRSQGEKRREANREKVLKNIHESRERVKIKKALTVRLKKDTALSKVQKALLEKLVQDDRRLTNKEAIIFLKMWEGGKNEKTNN